MKVRELIEQLQTIQDPKAEAFDTLKKELLIAGCIQDKDGDVKCKFKNYTFWVILSGELNCDIKDIPSPIFEALAKYKKAIGE